MIERSFENDSHTYVRAAHFIHNDDTALFGALAVVGRVEFTVIEDPNNPLLRRHAEISADETIRAASDVDQQFPGTRFADVAGNLFGEGARERFIEDELANLRAIMNTPGMGVFAVAGTEADVAAFIKAHLEQPGPIQ